jgi:membrane protease YdiL (CAAX protease family)
VHIRSAHRSILLVFVAAHFTLTAIANLVLFAGDAFRPLASATGGLVTGSLLVNLLFILFLVVGVVLYRGRLRPFDVGMIPAHIPTAVVWTLGLWGAAQAIHLLISLLSSGAVVVHPDWGNPLFMIGLILTQIVGNALFEEIAYRGFLFPQTYLHLGKLRPRLLLRLGTALLLSQGLFALSHVPNRIYLGMSAGEIAVDTLLLLAWGVLYTLIYLRTDNLFLVVGIHALGNAPSTLFSTAPVFSGAGASILIYMLAVAALFGYPLVRAYSARFRLQIDYGLDEGRSDYA